MIDRVEHWIEISNKWRDKVCASEGSTQTVCNGSIPQCSAENKADTPAPESSSANGQLSFNDFLAGQTIVQPEFPLLPASKGFCIAVRKHLDAFKDALAGHVFKTDTEAEH